MRLGLAKALGAAGALVATALVGGTLIGSALAGEADTDDGSSADASSYCDTFLDTFAAELGTTRDGLVAAGQTAANAAIDAAVAAGDVSTERADALRERIAEYDGEGCGWFRFGHGPGGHRGPGFVRGFIGANTVDAAAEALGLGELEVLDALRDAGSLEALAEAQGVDYATVSAAVTAAVRSDLDAAVAEGRITQERADAIASRVTAWLEAGGSIPGPRDGRGRGPWGGFGPWSGDAADGGEDDGG